MTIETQLEVIKKALEMGARIDINLHKYREEKKADEVSQEFANLLGIKANKWSHNNVNGIKVRDFVNCPIEVNVYFDKSEVEEESKQNEITHDVEV